MAYTAANSEQGSFAAELLVQKDDAGNYLDLAAIREAASLYGLLSGAVEVGGDALMFKLMKPLGGAVREAFGKKAARDAIREAAANRSLRPALRSFAGGAGKAAAVEGAQEFAQEGFFAQIEATTKNLLSDAGTNYYREHQAGAFSREGLSRMLEAGVIAAKAGPWFYAIPGGIRLTLDTRSALRAREFAEAHKELADKVAATKTRELSPARMESYLQTAGLDGDVLIPADAAWELQRKGMDLAGPLGWDVRDMEEAAALGHDIVMPAARLQALLAPEQMKAVADIMRESPYAKSALEAAKLNEDLPADMDGLIERAEDDALERSAIEGELERLRAEMTRAVTSAPHLMGQITSGTDAETSVGQYVDAQLGLIVRRARELARMGVPVSDTLSRVSFEGPVEDEQGRTVTPEEADALAQRNAEEKALAPFWDAVWGRLNADSLRLDFPDARRELAYQHGRGLFAGKGEGLAVDELADELRERGLLDSDADSSTLIERLKGMQRPDRRTRGKVFFQPLNEGVNLDRMVSTTVIHRKYPAATLKEKRKAVSNGEKARVLQAFREGVRNEDTGWVIGMSGNDFDEHLKSDYNSSYPMDQYEAVSALPELMSKAVLIESHADSHGRAEVKKVHRFYAPLSIDGDTYSVVLTVKEFQNGALSVDAVSPMKLYHHRLEKKMLPVQRGSAALQESPESDTRSISSYSLRELLEDVKDNDGNPYFQTEAETRLQNDIAVWEKAVDDIIAAGKVPSSPVQMLTQTPLVMNLLGTDTLTGKAAAAGGIYAAPHLFDGTHPNMTPDMWKQIPSAMVDPIAVFDSASPQGRLNGDIVFMLELTDANGATVVVPVALEGKAGSLKGVQLNIAKSAYAKENNGVPSNSWFVNQAQKNARYINEQKIKRWQYAAGVYFPIGTISNASGNRIYTDVDLDKLKSVHPGFYQSASSALGSTTFDASGNYVIQLFRGANLSTLTHETAHVFFLEMERLEREGLADERMLADLAALREWTAAMDDDAALKAEYDRYQKHAAYGGAEFDALPDYLKEDARSRAKQEMLARGFEQYLREGKAPSPQLEGVFARFRKWLMRVYRDALDLHVELSDEVRDVFDRILAHEEEMELRAEAADVREETARLLDALELKGARRQEIEGLITAAKDEAAERLRRARDADRLEQRRAWTREAREQMEREQVYVTRKAICRTPIDLAGFNDVNGEELGRALVKRLPGAATWREGGVEAEVFAAEQGYESAAAMARDIIDSPTPGERVKQLVDKRQAEHDALFDADEYLFGQEQLAEQQERIAEALEAKIQHITAEQRYRREAAGRTVGGEETIPALDDYEDYGSAARRLAGRDQLRTRARAVLDKKPMGEEVLPEPFRRAASRWMREERRAILRGDFGKALQANCRTRINIELARQSAERRETIRTLEKKTKEFLEMTRADSDARFAVLVLSQNIGLFNPTRKMLAHAGDKGRKNVEAFAARMREVGLMGAEERGAVHHGLQALLHAGADDGAACRCRGNRPALGAAGGG